MLELGKLRSSHQDFVQRLSKRGVDFSVSISKVLELDSQRRKIQVELDNLRAKNNKISQETGRLFKEGNEEDGS